MGHSHIIENLIFKSLAMFEWLLRLQENIILAKYFLKVVIYFTTCKR